jgi:hypothetical protein
MRFGLMARVRVLVIAMLTRMGMRMHTGVARVRVVMRVLMLMRMAVRVRVFMAVRGVPMGVRMGMSVGVLVFMRMGVGMPVLFCHAGFLSLRKRTPQTDASRSWAYFIVLYCKFRLMFFCKQSRV